MLYMAVTTDKYELPLYVADNAKELAEWAGVSENSIYVCVSLGRTGKTRGCKFVKVKEN